MYNLKPFKVEINLDLPPEERWTEIVQEHEWIFRMMGQGCNRHLLHSVPVERWMRAQEIPEDYKKEMQGIVKAVDDEEFTYECLFMHNIFYESGFYGQGDSEHNTSVGVLAAMSNGTVIHVRNLDWKHAPGLAAAGSLDVTFKRGGKPLFVAAMGVGDVYVKSAMSFRGWSFEQDSRRPGFDPESNLAWAEQGGQSSGFTARKFMEDGLSFAEAASKFSVVKWNAPQYFVMAGAGPYEGAVLTIDPDLPLQDVEVLNGRNRQMMYQINHDRWMDMSDVRDEIILLTFKAVLVDKELTADPETMWKLLTQEAPGGGPSALYTVNNLKTVMAIPGTGEWRHIVHREDALATVLIGNKNKGAGRDGADIVMGRMMSA